MQTNRLLKSNRPWAKKLPDLHGNERHLLERGFERVPAEADCLVIPVVLLTCQEPQNSAWGALSLGCG